MLHGDVTYEMNLTPMGGLFLEVNLEETLINFDTRRGCSRKLLS